MRGFSWQYYDRLLDHLVLNVKHGDQIKDLAISHDNRLLATVGVEGHCALWKIENGELVTRVRPDHHQFSSVSFSPTRLQLATGDSNGLINLWNPNDMELPLQSIKQGPRVRRVRFSRDGRRLLSFGEQGPVRIWDLATEKCIAPLPSGPKGSNVAEFSHDGSLVAIGGDQGKIRIYALPETTAILEIDNGSSGAIEPIQAICFSRDDRRLAVGGEHGFYRLYQTSTGEMIGEKHGVQGRLGSAFFLKEDQLLATTGITNTLEVHELDSGNLVSQLTTHRLGEGRATLSYDRRYLAIGSGDGTAKVVSVAKLIEPQVVWHESPVRQLQFSEDGGSLFSLAPNGEIKRFQLRTGSSEVLFPAADAGVRQFGFVPRLGRLFRGVPEPVIDYIDLESQSSSQLYTPFHSLAGMYVSGGREKLFLVSRRGVVLQYDAKETQEIERELSLESETEATNLVGGENLLAVGFNDGRIVILTQEPLAIRKTIETRGEAAVFAFHNQSLIVGTIYGDLQIHDVSSTSASEPRVIEGHGAEITTLLPFPDGERFVTGSRDHMIKIWDLRWGDEISTLYGHRRQVFSLALSPDARTLASGGMDGDIHIWRTTHE
ncbi:MAG: WD40 repeat domain-containing protein [Planctomycetaceae bacterium]|nr:WD40 repeat domain-containing protein [Planctomycetaceae bacterium]